MNTDKVFVLSVFIGVHLWLILLRNLLTVITSGNMHCHNGEVASIAIAEAESKIRMLRELATYFLFAYSISLALWLPVLVGRKVSPVFLSLGTAGPTLAALVTHRIFERNWRAVR